MLSFFPGIVIFFLLIVNSINEKVKINSARNMGCKSTKEPAGITSFAGDGKKQIQIILVGEMNVGKTTLSQRFVGKVFNPHVEATVGVDYVFLFVSVDDEDFRVQIWDTSGQERYHALSRSFYNKAAGVILVYDENRRSTLEKLESFWIPELKRQSCPFTHLLIVGNKTDMLRAGKPVVSDVELKRIGKDYRTTVCHMSAKEDDDKKCKVIIDDFCKRALIKKFELNSMESTASSSDQKPNEYDNVLL